MSTLANLKLSATKKSQSVTPVVQRRNKLNRKLNEQIQLAQAHLAGTNYTGTRLRTIRDDDGIRRMVEVPKKVRAWWWNAENGKIALNVRYGARVVEITKGKTAIEIATPNDLIPTLELETASVKLREGFVK